MYDLHKSIVSCKFSKSYHHGNCPFNHFLQNILSPKKSKSDKPQTSPLDYMWYTSHLTYFYVNTCTILGIRNIDIYTIKSHLSKNMEYVNKDNWDDHWLITLSRTTDKLAVI